jgi:hypothetical protein
MKGAIVMVRTTTGQATYSPQRGAGGFIRDIPDQDSPQRGRSPQDEEEEEDNDIREMRPNGVMPDAPLTRTGQPDRRFLGARHLPPPEEPNPDYTKARTGGMMGGQHITLTGKPDRRFKENRGLTDDEVNGQWADILNHRYRQH